MSAEAMKAAQDALEQLPEKDKRELVDKQYRILNSPQGRGLTKVWMTVLIILALVIVLFGVFGYLQLRVNGEGTEILFGLATTALGGIVGLLIQSPTQS